MNMNLYATAILLQAIIWILSKIEQHLYHAGTMVPILLCGPSQPILPIEPLKEMLPSVTVYEGVGRCPAMIRPSTFFQNQIRNREGPEFPRLYVFEAVYSSGSRRQQERTNQMAMEKFEKRRLSAIPAMSIRKNGSLSFNEMAVNEFPIKGKEHVDLYFDKEEQTIGIRPIESNAALTSFTISREKGKTYTISCPSFLKKCKLAFTLGSRVYPITYDDTREMIIAKIGPEMQLIDAPEGGRTEITSNEGRQHA